MSRLAQAVVLRFVLALSAVVASAQPAWGQPRLAVNGVDAPASVAVGAGSVARVVVSDGPANPTDWIGFYPVGAADTAYLVWYYLNGATSAPATGLASAALHVLVPVSPGTYEVRLFAANGYARLATSGPITVEPSGATIRVNDTVPPAALQISPASPIAATMVNGPGNPGDWVGLFAVGTADTSSLSWQFLNGTTTLPSAGLTTATLQFFTPSTLGTYELRLFAGGGYARLAVSSTLVVGPSQATLSVNGVTPPAPVTATAGSVATVTVAGAPGNATDWIGLYATGAPDTAYLQWRYLNGALTPPAAGTSDASLSFLMPTAPGAYEFRLYAHNAYDRLASSSVVTVPVSSAHLAVNGVDAPGAVTVAAGTPLTVVLTDGPANPSDWVGLFAAAAADSSPIAWSYLDGHTTPPTQGLVAATLQFLAPVAAGTYEIRAFAGNTFNRLAASGPLSVTPSPATIAVNGTTPPTGVTVPPASTLALQVTDGPGNPADWIGLFRASDPDASPLTWQYLNGSTAPPAVGLTAASLTVTLPADTGTYEVRLFADGSYNRLATSSAVSAGFPAVTVRLTSPFPGTVFPVGSQIPLAADVSISNGTVNAVEFHADGSTVGTAMTPPYSVTWGSGLVGSHAIVVVVVDSHGGRTQSAPVSVAISQTGPGLLGAPIITPPGGTFGGDQTVIISAAPGATVRFTTDGSWPDVSSAIYTGPLVIPADATVMAQAFQAGWSASVVASATFQIDRAGPTVDAALLPLPNAAGWNHTSVAVTFRCADPSGVQSCSQPAQVTGEGTSVVEGEGVDRVGNRTTTTATVRIDRFPPRVTMTSPSDRLVTADGTLTVTGAVSDDGSGVGRVTCNGMPVQLGEGGAVSCDVPLRPGLNPIILHATDVAGNSASVGVRATRVVPAASLSIAPSQRTILVGETRSLQVVDQGGLPVASDVGWTVDNAAVASLTSESGMATVQGLAAGTATVTVTHAGLTATAEINVIAAASLPTGAVRWKSLAGSSGIATTSGPLYATRVDDAVPDLYVLQGAVSGSQRLQGVFLDGTRANAWDVSPPQPGSSDVWLALADRAGGVVLGTRDWSTGTGGLVRIPGTPDALPWRYDSPAIDAEVVGQSPDGTIYLLEHVGQSWQAVGLDGDTGGVRFRYTPPGTSHYALYNIDCHAGYHSISESGPELSRGVVGYDGALYALASTSTSVYDYYSQEGCNQSGATPTAYHATVSVVRVTADGTGRVDELQTKAGTTSDALDLHGDTLVPDPRGGVHAQWDSRSFDWSTLEYYGGDIRHARAGAESSGGQQIGVLPFDRIGDGVGFDANGVAYDLDTMAVKFTPPVAGTFVTALAGGGVAVTDGITLSEIDGYGEVVRQATMVAVPDVRYGGGPLWTTVDSDGVTALERPDLNSHAPAFPDVNLSRHPSDPAYPYRTQDEAAIAALKRFHGKSVKEFTEYGGQVCEVTRAAAPARFGYGPAHWGLPCQFFSPCSVDPGRFPCPGPLRSDQSTRSVGEYHTHPDSEAVSGYDRNRLRVYFERGEVLVGYVSTSCGWVRKYGFDLTGNWFNERLSHPPGSVVFLFQPTPPCSVTEGMAWSSLFYGGAELLGRRQ